MRSPADLFPVRLPNRHRFPNPTPLQWLLGVAVVGTVGYFVFKPKAEAPTKKPPKPKTFYFHITSSGLATKASLVGEQMLPTGPLPARITARVGDHIVWEAASGLKDRSPRSAKELVLVTPRFTPSDSQIFDFEILPAARGKTLSLGVNFKQLKVDRIEPTHRSVNVLVV